jgi:hypothetical protein
MKYTLGWNQCIQNRQQEQRNAMNQGAKFLPGESGTKSRLRTEVFVLQILPQAVARQVQYFQFFTCNFTCNDSVLAVLNRRWVTL